MAANVPQTGSTVTQFRFSDRIYSFKIGQDRVGTLKIYDLSHQLFFKQPFFKRKIVESSTPKWETLEMRLKPLHEKAQLPKKFLLSVTAEVELAQEELKTLIKIKQAQIPPENALSEECKCCITHEIPIDPVVDDAGHTFEKSAILTWLQTKTTCPQSRHEIQSLTPNYAVKAIIEGWRSQGVIPTFGQVVAENRDFATKNLGLAKDYIGAGNFKEALDTLKRAFLHTKRWEDYVALPELFDKMQEKEKALLARLYLAGYQVDDKKIGEAIKTLTLCQKELPEVTRLLMRLCRSLGQIEPAIQWGLSEARRVTNDKPDEAAAIYWQLLSYDPNHLLIYSLLLPLLKNPAEKANLLLKAACHMIEKGEYEKAQGLCKQAEEFDQRTFLDHFLTVDILRKKGENPKEKLLQLTAIYEKDNSLVQVYKQLASLEYDPVYYRKILELYAHLNRPQHLLKWAKSFLSKLMERQEWQEAEQVALGALNTLKGSIPLYEALEKVYSQWESQKLEGLWYNLGAAYGRENQLEQAEKVFRLGFEQFRTFDYGVELASLLFIREKKKEAVRLLHAIAIHEELSERVESCYASICKIDPPLDFLELHERRILKLHRQNLKLIENVAKLTEEVSQLKAIPREVQKVREELKSHIVATSQNRVGKEEWERLFPETAIKGPTGMPQALIDKLKSPCPFNPGRLVAETHALTLIIPGVSIDQFNTLIRKKGLNLNYLYEAVKGYPHLVAQILAQPTWCLAVPIPGSGNKTYAEQKQLLNQYQLISVRDAVFTFGMNFLTGGKIWTPGDQKLYIRCADEGFDKAPTVSYVVKSKDSIYEWDININSSREAVGAPRAFVFGSLLFDAV